MSLEKNILNENLSMLFFLRYVERLMLFTMDATVTASIFETFNLYEYKLYKNRTTAVYF